MERENCRPCFDRSKTDTGISVCGSGFQGNSLATSDDGPRLLQRSRTEVGSACSVTSGSEFDVNRVLYEISRKVNANKKSLLYLFRSNDSSGRGAVSREALHRILRILHGFLQSQHYEAVLRRLNLNNRTQITYEVFMACFEDADAIQKKYLRKQLLEPFWRAASADGERDTVEPLEKRDERRYLEVATGGARSQSADGRLANMKRQLLESFPAIRSCLTENGSKDLLLTSRMLRSVISRAGISASIDDMNTLWEKLDTARCGLVPLRRFYSFIDPIRDLSPERSCGDAKRVPGPKQSNGAPRLAVGSKGGSNVPARSFAHYRYPQRNKQAELAQVAEMFDKEVTENINAQQSLPNKLSNYVHAPPPHLAKSLPVSRKRPLLLDSDKPIAAQLALRLVEPRDRFMAYCKRFIECDENSGGCRVAIGQLLGCLLFCGKPVPENVANQLLAKVGAAKSSSPEKQNEPETTVADGGAAGVGQKSEGENTKKFDLKSFGCAIYDPDCNRILANILHNPEHFFRLLASDVCTEWCESDPTDLEAVEIKFSKYMYQDIIRLITELRRIDRNNSGVVSDREFEMAMTRVFNTTFSRKQLQELIRGTDDGAGNVIVGDFIKTMFNTAQPDVCRILGLSSSSSKRTATTRQQQQVDSSVERATKEQQAAAAAAQAAIEQANAAASMQMTEEQAVDLLKKVMKDRFHSFDKQFVALDVKQTKRISQFQLHQILRNMKIHPNMRELAFMWKAVPSDPDGLCSYRRFLLHFMTPGDVKNNQKQQQQQQQQQQIPQSNENAVSTDSNGGSAEMSTGNNYNANEIHQMIKKEKELIEKGDIDQVYETIRDDVCRNWGILKEQIRQADLDGQGHIDVEHLPVILKSAKINFSEEALSYVMKKHTSVVRNRRRFFYMPFMRYFTRRFAQETNNGANHKCHCSK